MTDSRLVIDRPNKDLKQKKNDKQSSPFERSCENKAMCLFASLPPFRVVAKKILHKIWRILKKGVSLHRLLTERMI